MIMTLMTMMQQNTNHTYKCDNINMKKCRMNNVQDDMDEDDTVCASSLFADCTQVL